MKKTYLIKAESYQESKETHWKQLSGQEFYEFIRTSKETHHFIHLRSEQDTDVLDIHIETTREVYESWKKEDDRHHYLKRTRREVEIVSLDAGSDEEQSDWYDTISNGEKSLEETIEEKDELERLRNAVALLDSEEKRIIYELFFEEPPLTMRQLAQKLGMAVSSLQYKKKKIFAKIRIFMLNREVKKSE